MKLEEAMEVGWSSAIWRHCRRGYLGPESGVPTDYFIGAQILTNLIDFYQVYSSRATYHG
jgi:hypothetical protein